MTVKLPNTIPCPLCDDDLHCSGAYQGEALYFCDKCGVVIHIAEVDEEEDNDFKENNHK